MTEQKAFELIYASVPLSSFTKAFKDLSRFLWVSDAVVIGGMALAAHGHSRSTVDIDILVLEMSEEEAAEIRSYGFKLPTSHTGTVWRAVHKETKVEVEILTPKMSDKSALMKDAIKHSVRKKIAGTNIEIKVPELEYLLALKVLRLSDTDVSDITMFTSKMAKKKFVSILKKHGLLEKFRDRMKETII